MNAVAGSARRWVHRVLAAGAALAFTQSIQAEVVFEVEYLDSPGRGFFDSTERPPMFDNPGTTLGEQRRLAFERAVSIWTTALNSDVPVVIEASFDPEPQLYCDDVSAVLGGARADAAFRRFTGAPREDLFYPSPLADKLAGKDLDPGAPDISAIFNPRLDEECLGELGWYYGYQPNGSQADFVNTVLHELAHGLGFASLVDETTGAAFPGLSPYDALAFDNSLQRYWDEMTIDERAQSARTPFNLVWPGGAVAKRAPDVLALGAPRLDIAGDETRSIVLVGESNFGPTLDEGEVEGQLVQWSPSEACGGGSVAEGQVVMLRSGNGCNDVIPQYQAAQAQGAVGVILRDEYGQIPPWAVDATVDGAAIPALTIAAADFDQLRNSLIRGTELSATLTAESQQLVGADQHGRVYLSTTYPVLEGSSVTHWDRSTRRRRSSDSEPDALLMEPLASGIVANQVDELTAQLLEDLGWGDASCGNGKLEAGESCDDGEDNSDSRPNSCRGNCRLPRCGDGVVDSFERCDDRRDAGGCPRDCGRGQPSEPSDAAAPMWVDAGPDAGVGAEPKPKPRPDVDASISPSERSPVSLTRVRGGGCDCAVPLGSSTGSWPWLAALVGYLAARRRR